jgi:hypothetical protein
MSQTYSFLDVHATIAGPGASFQLGGPNSSIQMGAGVGVADEGITISRAEDKNTQTTGADGEAMNVLNAANNGSVTVRLQKTSATNKLLMDLYNAQRGSSTTWGQNVISITDIARGDKHTCRKVAFKKVPDINYGKAPAVVEWVFDAGHIDTQLGSGSPSLS